MSKLPYYTHTGFFHADEVTGWVICEMAGVCDQLIRLTDLSNIPDDGIVADIGRDWDPEALRFDHHHGFFTRDNGYPFASAGMLWQKFWYNVLLNVLGAPNKEYINPPVGSHEELQKVANRVDETLIRGIDAHDADSAYKVKAECSAGEVRVLTISNIISGMNTINVGDQDAQRDAFLKASDLVKAVLISHIRAAEKFLEAKEKFSEVADIDGRIIVLSEGLPWKEIVHEEYPDALFVISPSNHPGNPWSMIAVPVEPESREVKCPIQRSEDFDGFIHQGKWIAGADSVGELKELAYYNLKSWDKIAYRFKIGKDYQDHQTKSGD